MLPTEITVMEITHPGGPEVLVPATRPLPQPKAGEVLIEVAAAGVNRPDVFQRKGAYPPPPGASDIPGLEVAGRIVALGEGVDLFRPGDLVCALLTGGGYASYATAPAVQCLAYPKGFDAVQAAALPETFFTVWHNLFQRAGLRAGETLLVHGGTSGIGSVAIQLAKQFGASVFTTAAGAEKCQTCRDLGADVAIDHHAEDFVARVAEETSGRGVDVVLDMVGGDYLGRNIACLAADGRHVSLAFLKGSRVEIDLVPVMTKRLTLTGSTLRPRPVAVKAAIAAELKKRVWPLLDAGKVAPLIHAVFPLEKAAEAHRLMESGTHRGKIVLTLGR